MSRASQTQVLSRILEGVRLSSLGTEVGLRNSAPFSLLRQSDLKQLERRPGLVIRTLSSHSGNICQQHARHGAELLALNSQR